MTVLLDGGGSITISDDAFSPAYLRFGFLSFASRNRYLYACLVHSQRVVLKVSRDIPVLCAACCPVSFRMIKNVVGLSLTSLDGCGQSGTSPAKTDKNNISPFSADFCGEKRLPAHHFNESRFLTAGTAFVNKIGAGITVFFFSIYEAGHFAEIG